ncbi:hypothetical protein [Shimazuella kribbensis]|uniref:hypothetical protein n=1 Tax=Shimazuella kribbensis TaxID=139808 RepID=UPI00041678C9|nr:hypothetical protein [Shimazuella kribbensis]
MKKHKLDMEKLIQEVMGFQGEETAIKIDQTAMELLDTKQLQIDLIRKHLRGDLAREFAEQRLHEVSKEIKRLEKELTDKSYWWL